MKKLAVISEAPGIGKTTYRDTKLRILDIAVKYIFSSLADQYE